ncbi:MAG: putative signal transduction protein [Proteobacteria bacterium]|nr:putative signal transduction protein [Pseudomonadota bacterium]
MNRVDILKELAAEVSEGKLSLPASVNVALRVREALDSPECHIDMAARVVQAEPILSARVVAMANAAVFNISGNEITDVRTAVSRLGFRVVSNLATVMMVRQMAQSPNTRAERQIAAKLWEYTTHVASLARMLARQVTHQDPEAAMFAAVVHDIGGFYLLSRAAEFPGMLNEGLGEDDAEGELALGRAVLKALTVPQAVMEAIEVFWAGYLALPPVSLGDTLLLASDLTPIERPLLSNVQGYNRPEAVANIDMVVGQQKLQAILDESREEVDSLLAVLRF